MDSRTTGPGGSASLQNLTFGWNEIGSLTRRTDDNRSLTETFFYDTLGRLDYSELNGAQNLNVNYDTLGNITFKSDVGTYNYGHATKKHAVTSITSGGSTTHTYDYDNNGNMTSRDGVTTTWFSYDLPNQISQAGASSQFSYTHDRQRWKQQIVSGASTETITYIGDQFEKRVVGTDTEYRHLVIGGTGPVAYVKRTDTATSTYYVSTDHLGSTSVITNESGAVLVNESFDAFGNRRNGATWSGSPTSGDMTQIAATTRRGYTFHEGLDSLKLIHMNGRVFDPTLGRFMSADPFVQSPFDGQSFNRYSYTFNDPLSNVDPSGFASCWHNESVMRGDGSITISADRYDTCDDPSWWYDAPIGPTGGGGGIAGPGHRDRSTVSDSTVGGACPGGCHTSGIAIPEVTPEVRAATTRFYQNLGENFIPGLGLYQAATGEYLFSGDEASRVGGLLASAPFVGIALKRVVIIPKVASPKLANLVNDLYKGARGPNPIGTGNTADAIRNELATGLPTHGVFHSDKGRQYVNALNNWLRKNPNADYYDRVVAESLRMDLEAALQGL